jgi:hypothetical protein
VDHIVVIVVVVVVHTVVQAVALEVHQITHHIKKQENSN